MNFKQYYLGCLSHASYYIGSGVEAAVIDPQRDIQQYLDEAAANGQKIKYVIETHSHADLVSGHIELAERTGAEIVFGQRAATNFPTHKAADGDVLQVGSVKLTFFETPGHTPEGICILAIDESAAEDEPAKLFTGDTLFIGDVGRLVVVTRGREDDDELAELPWPLSRKDLSRFEERGLRQAGFSEMPGDEDPPAMRFVVEYERPPRN